MCVRTDSGTKSLLFGCCLFVPLRRTTLGKRGSGQSGGEAFLPLKRVEGCWCPFEEGRRTGGREGDTTLSNRRVVSTPPTSSGTGRGWKRPRSPYP